MQVDQGNSRKLVRAALDAIEPGGELVRHWPDELRSRACHVLAVGKAAGPMLAAVVRGGLCRVQGAMMIGVPGAAGAVRGLSIPVEAYTADHPLPTQRNIDAARQVAEFVTMAHDGFTQRDDSSLVVLLSGGASALLTLPAPGVTLEDIRAVTSALLKAGAPIEELNTVRKHLEVLKGGGLVRLAAPMPVWTLILSDVIGDDLASIGSGPTCADPTTFADALGVLDRYALRDAAPGATRALAEGAAGARTETLKTGDALLTRVHHRIIGNNTMAVDAVARRAHEMGFEPVDISYGVWGEARDVGKQFAVHAIRLLRDQRRPCCLVAGGETTVTVRGGGKGGRNQELALAAAIEIAGRPGIQIASFSTDGVDGPTDAAGAVADGNSVAGAAARGVDAAGSLAENDSYRFFEAAGGLIVTGPTGTNVNDVIMALVTPG